MIRPFAPWAALLMCCSSAAADSLAPIVVQAPDDQDAEAQVGDVVLEEYTGSHRRIEQEQLQQAGASLGVLLSFETGVQHRQAGAEGSYSSVSIRGSTGAQTPIYWDGMRLNGAANPSVDLSDLELLGLGAVDIYRNTSPAQLGAGGMAGALNLRSLDPQQQRSKIKLELGSFGARVLQLGSSTSGDKWQLSGTLSTRQSDNNFELLNNNGTPQNRDDDVRETRNNAQFERHALLSKLSYQVSDSLQWDASVQLNQRVQGVPEWRNNPDNQASYETRTSYLQINRRQQSDGNTDWNTRVGLYRQWRRQQYEDQLRQVSLAPQSSQSAIDTSGLTAYAEYIGDRGTLAFHMDGRHETLDSRNRLNGEWREARRNSLELTTAYSRFSADERWLISPSLHLKAHENRFKSHNLKSALSQQDNTGTFSLGLRHTLNASTLIRANVGQHKREPSFYELFGNEGLYVGNDELLAESGLNVDVTLERTHANGHVEIGVFRNARKELISTVFNAQGIGRSINIGEARLSGLELGLTQQLDRGLELRLNASYLDSKNESNLSAVNGKQLPGLARGDMTVRLSKHHSQWAIWLESQTLIGKYYDTINLLPAEDATQYKLGASWQQASWQTHLSIDNITDERVQDYNGFDKPGRSAQLSFQYQF